MVGCAQLNIKWTIKIPQCRTTAFCAYHKTIQLYTIVQLDSISFCLIYVLLNAT